MGKSKAEARRHCKEIAQPAAVVLVNPAFGLVTERKTR